MVYTEKHTIIHVGFKATTGGPQSSSAPSITRHCYKLLGLESMETNKGKYLYKTHVKTTHLFYKFFQSIIHVRFKMKVKWFTLK